MLLQIPEVLTPAELERMQQILARAEPEWSDGRATAGPQAATVKNNQQLPWRGASTQALQAILLPALQRHAVFFSATLPKRFLPPMFNRYGGAHNTYGNHIDQAVRVLPDGSGRVRSDISCTVFLAEPDSYEGGELVIEDSFGPQRVKLPAGHAVVYPGTSVHRVEPVSRGQRVASFFWIESMVRSDEQRRLLFDMDMALMRLRQQQGETPEAVTLTGTYHNLLRLWADT